MIAEVPPASQPPLRPGRAAAPLGTLRDWHPAGGVAGQGATVGLTPGVPVCDLGGAFVNGVCVCGEPHGQERFEGWEPVWPLGRWYAGNCVQH